MRLSFFGLAFAHSQESLLHFLPHGLAKTSNSLLSMKGIRRVKVSHFLSDLHLFNTLTEFKYDAIINLDKFYKSGNYNIRQLLHALQLISLSHYG